jgi:hypothetical protein
VHISETRLREASPFDPPRDLITELDNLRFARIVELGALASNIWLTISLAAERGEPLTIEKFYQIAAKATRETHALMRGIGSGEVV